MREAIEILKDNTKEKHVYTLEYIEKECGKYTYIDSFRDVKLIEKGYLYTENLLFFRAYPLGQDKTYELMLSVKLINDMLKYADKTLDLPMLMEGGSSVINFKTDKPMPNGKTFVSVTYVYCIKLLYFNYKTDRGYNSKVVEKINLVGKWFRDNIQLIDSEKKVMSDLIDTLDNVTTKTKKVDIVIDTKEKLMEFINEYTRSKSVTYPNIGIMDLVKKFTNVTSNAELIGKSFYKFLTNHNNVLNKARRFKIANIGEVMIDSTLYNYRHKLLIKFDAPKDLFLDVVSIMNTLNTASIMDIYQEGIKREIKLSKNEIAAVLNDNPVLIERLVEYDILCDICHVYNNIGLCNHVLSDEFVSELARYYGNKRYTSMIRTLEKKYRHYMQHDNKECYITFDEVKLPIPDKNDVIIRLAVSVVCINLRDTSSFMPVEEGGTVTTENNHNDTGNNISIKTNKRSIKMDEDVSVQITTSSTSDKIHDIYSHEEVVKDFGDIVQINTNYPVFISNNMMLFLKCTSELTKTTKIDTYYNIMNDEYLNGLKEDDRSKIFTVRLEYINKSLMNIMDTKLKLINKKDNAVKWEYSNIDISHENYYGLTDIEMKDMIKEYYTEKLKDQSISMTDVFCKFMNDMNKCFDLSIELFDWMYDYDNILKLPLTFTTDKLGKVKLPDEKIYSIRHCADLEHEYTLKNVNLISEIHYDIYEETLNSSMFSVDKIFNKYIGLFTEKEIAETLNQHDENLVYFIEYPVIKALNGMLKLLKELQDSDLKSICMKYKVHINKVRSLYELILDSKKNGKDYIKYRGIKMLAI